MGVFKFCPVYWDLMKKLTLAILVITLFSGCARLHIDRLEKKKPSPVVQKTSVEALWDGAYLLYAKDAQGSIKMVCGATAISHKEGTNDYLFLTAAHCAKALDGVDAYVGTGNEKGDPKYYALHFTAVGDESTGNDFAVGVSTISDPVQVVEIGHDATSPGQLLFNVSGPERAPKQLFIGYVSNPKMDRKVTFDEEGKSDWTGNMLFVMPGEGPGSSGSALMCDGQNAICAIVVGRIPGATVACPIDRFRAWIEKAASLEGTI